MDHFDDIGPSVVMASPGMMQSGLSRELFESWCTDKRNGVIIAGYCVEGTLAKVKLEVLRHQFLIGDEWNAVGTLFSLCSISCLNQRRSPPCPARSFR